MIPGEIGVVRSLVKRPTDEDDANSIQREREKAFNLKQIIEAQISGFR